MPFVPKAVDAPKEHFPSILTPDNPLNDAIEIYHADTDEVVEHGKLIEADFSVGRLRLKGPIGRRGQQTVDVRNGPWRPRWRPGWKVTVTKESAPATPAKPHDSSGEPDPADFYGGYYGGMPAVTP